MSKQEILERAIVYLNKMQLNQVEEVYHFIEYLYFRQNMKNIHPINSDTKSLLLNGPVWTDEDYHYFQEQSSNFRNWRTYDIT